MTRYVIQDREAGNVIEHFATLELAQERLIEFEQSDKEEGIYTPNFYEIVEEEA